MNQIAEKERKLFQEVEGIVARLTRFKKQTLELPTAVIEETLTLQKRKERPSAERLASTTADATSVSGGSLTWCFTAILLLLVT